MSETNQVLQEMVNTSEETFRSIINEGGSETDALAAAGEKAFELAMTAAGNEPNALVMLETVKELLILKLLKASLLTDVHTPEVDQLRAEFEIQEAAVDLYRQLKNGGTEHLDAVQQSADRAYDMSIDSGMSPTEAWEVVEKVRKILAQLPFEANELADEVVVDPSLKEWNGEGEGDILDRDPVLPTPGLDGGTGWPVGSGEFGDGGPLSGIQQVPFSGGFGGPGTGNPGGPIPTGGSGPFSPGQPTPKPTEPERPDSGPRPPKPGDEAPAPPQNPSTSTRVEPAQLALVADDLNMVEGDGGTTASSFVVTRSGGTDYAVTVDWSIVPGSVNGVEGEDFAGGALPSGTVTFVAGQTSVEVPFEVTADLVGEEDDQYVIQLSNPGANGVITVGEVRGTIINDDHSFAVAATSSSIAEGTTGNTMVEFVVTRSGELTGSATIDYAITGANGADVDDIVLAALPSGTLSFADGESEQTVSLEVSGDSLVEGDETFTLNLSNQSAGFISEPNATATIVNDDAYYAVTGPADAPEGIPGTTAPFTFTVTRSEDVDAAGTIEWRVNPAAGINADDFAGDQDVLTDNGGLPSGTVTFSPGETSQTFTVQVKGDLDLETDETLEVTLSNPVGGEIATSDASAVIQTDDDSFSISTPDVAVLEGDSGATVTYTVTRTGSLKGEYDLSWSITGDVSGADFGQDDLPAGDLHFADGEQTKTFTLTIADDYLIEGEERFQVQLSADPSENLTFGAQTSETTAIQDDEAGFQIEADAASVAEGAEGEVVLATFTVTRSIGVGSGASINFRAIPYGSTPAAAGDFVPGHDSLGDNGGMPSGIVTFAPGEETKTVTIQLSGDNDLGPDEAFAVVLYDPPVGARILTDTAPMKILNDDGLVSISAIEPVLNEGTGAATSSFRFSVTRTGHLEGSANVDYAVAPFGESQIQPGDISGGGFSTGTVNFAPGQNEVIVTVDIAGDSVLEGNEDFEVNLQNPGDNLKIQNGTATATIRQDDAAIEIEALDAVRIEGNGTSEPHTFKVTRTGNTDVETTVNWSVEGTGVNPVSADDFESGLPGGSVIFAVGETEKVITITPDPDTVYEEAETYDVVLTLPGTGAVLVNDRASGTILNDETGFILVPTSLSLTEGNSGSTIFSFTIERTGVTDTEVSIDWNLEPDGATPAQAEDFHGGAFPSGSVTFVAGVNSTVVNFEVATDSVVEGNEQYLIRLSNPSGNADIVNGEAHGTIYNDDAAFSIAADESIKAEGHAGDTLIGFVITRTGDTGSIDSVAYSVTGSGGQPADAADFGGSLPAGTAVFNIGETSKTVFIAVSGDDTIEPDEGFTVTLDSPSEGSQLVAGEVSATATITNDDDRFDIAGVTLTTQEGGDGAGGTIIFTVTRSGATTTESSVEWNIGGRGAHPVEAADFSAVTGVVTFLDGETEKQVEVQIVGDYLIENDEDFTLSLANPSLGSTIGTGSVNGTVLNDDVGLAINTATTDLAEGDSGTRTHSFTVTRTGVTSGETSVDWAVSGTGAAPVNADDFGGTLPSGTITFADGESVKTIEIVTSGDTAIEPNEDFVVTLSNADSNADIHVSQANGSIISDDIGIEIVADQGSVAEGAVSDTRVLQFTVTRSGDLASAVELDWEATGMSADDFTVGTVFSDRISFGVNETTKTINLTLTGDAEKETDETITVTLTNPADNPSHGRTTLISSSAATTVTNDDADVSITAAVAAQNEGEPAVTSQTSYTFIVTRSGDTTVASSLDWQVQVDGNENSASVTDFLAGQNERNISSGLPSGTVNFAPNDLTAQVTVLVATDDQVEKDELFDVVLINPDDQTEISGSTVTATIINDDTGFTISAVSAEHDEGDTGTTDFTFTVTRAGNVDQAGSVDWAVTGSGTNPADAADFGGTLPFGTVNFSAGETYKTFTIPVSGDSQVENDEGFTVSISNALAGGVAQDIVDSQATGLIVNEDHSFAVSAANPTIAEASTGTTQIAFVVTRTGDLRSSATIDYAISGSNGATVDDIMESSFPSGTLSFASGEDQLSVVFNVIGDTIAEGDETFTINLSNQSSGSITTGTATTIVENDDTNYALTAPADVVEGTAGSTPMVFTVTRTGDTTGSGSVKWRVSTGAGITSTDFFGDQDVLGDNGGLPSGTVNFGATETSQQITVQVRGDLVLENDETVTVVLSHPVNGTITQADAAATVLTDDDSFSISTGTASKVEGNSDSTITYTVARTGSLEGARDLTWTITGVDGFDPATDLAFGQAATGTVSFADGQPSANIVINLSGDSQYENDETMTVTLSDAPANTVFGVSSASTVITNDDASVSISALQATKSEGNPAGYQPYTFTITRTGNIDQESSVEWRVGGGTNPVTSDDFPAGVDTLGGNNGLPSGSVTFAEGDPNSKTITINILSDSVLENDEALQVTLSNPSTGTEVGTAVASGLVQNDDAELNITAGTATKVEGDAEHGTGVAYTYTVTRTGNRDQTTTVDWSVVHDTTDSNDFTNGLEDHITPSGTLTFASGEITKTITVYAYGDTGAGSVEGDEAFSIELANANKGATIGTLGSYDSTIEDDDTQLTLSVNDYSQPEKIAGENTIYRYTVTRTGDLDKATTFSWAVTDIDPEHGSNTIRMYDYDSSGSSYNYEYSSASTGDFLGSTFASGTGSFASGASTAVFDVEVLGDNSAENDEWFAVSLTGTSGYDQIHVVYTDPDTTDGTRLLQTYWSGNTYYDNQEVTSSYNGVDENTNYIYSSIERDEAEFRLLDKEVQGVNNNTLLSVHAEGDTSGDGGSDEFVAHVFAVQRLYSTAGTHDVDWVARGYSPLAGHAADADDFKPGQDLNSTGDLASGTVTFTEGEEWAYITIYTKTDDVGEYDETFRVFLENPPDGSVVYYHDGESGSSSLYNYGYITNDDTRFDASVNDVVEGGTLTYTITRQGDSRGRDTVDWAIAVAGDEATNEKTNDTSSWYKLDVSDIAGNPIPENGSASFDAPSSTWSGTLTFEDGETTKTITVNTQDDSFSETWKEQLSISLSNGQNSHEGESNDDLETAATGYNATANVYDNEPDPILTLSVQDNKTSIYEGTAENATYSGSNVGNTVTFIITRTDQNGDPLDYSTTVGWYLNGGSRVNYGSNCDVSGYTSANYVNKSSYYTYGNVYFAANETEKEVTVTFNGENYVENDEVFNFRLMEADQAESSSYQVYGGVADQNGYGPANIDISTENNYIEQQITIKNDDIRLWIDDWDSSGSDGYDTNLHVSGYEGNDLVFDMVRAGRTDVAVTIGYTVTTGTAAVGDFTSASGSFTLDALSNSYSSKVIQTVTIEDFFVDDIDVEADENFTLTLSVPADQDGSSVRFQSYAINSTAWNNGYSGIKESIELSGTVYDDDTTYTLIPSDTNLAETDEGNESTFAFTLNRGGVGYTGPATVYWRVEAVGGNQADAGDFTSADTLNNNGGLPSGSVTFDNGILSQNFSVLIDGDSTREENETFRVVVYEDKLTGPDPEITNSHSIATANLTIVNDDTAVVIGDGVLTETDGNQVLSFTVTRSGDTNVVSSASWQLNHVTTSDADFSGATSGNLTFAAGVPSQTINITVVGDITPEDVETFTIKLNNFININDQIDDLGEGTINNDDSSFSISAGAAAAEGNGQTFTISRTHSTEQDQVINWVVSADSATADDFGGTLPSGSVTFAKGQLTKTITVTSSADTTAEADEEYTVNISLGSGTDGDVITTDSATGTILNDDTAYSIRLAGQEEYLEGHSGTTAFTFTVARTGNISGSGSVEWRLSSASAEDDDFTTSDERGDNNGLPSGIVNFAENIPEQTVTVLVSGDLDVEAAEQFTLTLSNGVNGSVLQATADATILNDDSSVTISAVDAVKEEGDSGTVTFSFNVNRSGYLGEAETVDYVVIGAGANPADANDFGGSFPGGTLALAAGSADTPLYIQVSGDQLAELDEGFQVVLSNPSTGVTIATTTASGTIQADDIVFDVAPPAAPVVEGNPGDANVLEFVVTRTGNISGTQTLNWTVAGITADPVDASDFVAASGDVTFGPDDTTKTIQVQIQGDYEGEANEGLRLTLTGPGDVTFLNNTADAQILDDDASLRISATNAVLVEGDEGDTTVFTFTVERTGNLLLAVDVDWNVQSGGAVDAADFEGGVLPGGSLHFDANETSQTVEVTVAGDIAVEGNELFNVILSNPSAGADIAIDLASGTILSDDVEWSVAETSIPAGEGDGPTEYTYTITRTGSDRATTMGWSVAGSGGDPADASDFEGNVLQSGLVVFGQGVMSQEITVTIDGDSVVEADENFTLTLNEPTDGLTHSFSQQSVETTIVNDDDVMSIAVADADKAEGSGPATGFTFTVTRSGSLVGASSVGWEITDVDTTVADFSAVSGTVNFAEGQDTAIITVYVAGDRNVEEDESFSIGLNNPGPGSTIDPVLNNATGIIRNDDVDFTLSVMTGSVIEGDISGGQLQYLVTRTGDLTQESSADWSLTGDVDSADFLSAVSGTVTFAAGESEQYITLNVAADGNNEGNENFSLLLSNPSANVDFIDNGAAGTIVNDDDSLSIVIADADKAEGSGGTTPFTFEITRTGSTAGTASVVWSVAGVGTHAAENADFAQLTGTVTFADGEESKIISVPVVGDNDGEFAETFSVTLSDASFGSTIVDGSAEGRIVNDDPALLIAADQVSKLEGGDGEFTTFTFTVTREGALDIPASAQWQVVPSGDNPAQALDFGGFFPSGMIAFGVGEGSKQITVNVTGDVDGEASESFQVVLSNAVNADIIEAAASTIIANDDSSLSISTSTPELTEGNTGETKLFIFTVDRIGPSDGIVTVDWRVKGNGDYWADPGDFQGGQDGLGNGGLPSGSLTFAAGVMQQTIEITIVGDNIPGTEEGFTVDLENAVGATLVEDSAEAVILNDDSQFSISAQTFSQDEGDAGEVTAYNFTVSRVGDTGSESSVSWRVIGEGDNPVDGDDFVSGMMENGVLSFGAGESSKQVTIEVAGDYFIESQEGFSVEIYNPADNATVSSAGSVAKVNILNDDAGTAGSDILVGSDGADEITGLGDSDTLTGGAGADRFRYTASDEGADHITDFETVRDKIALDIGAFGTLGTTGDLVVANAQGFDTDVDTTLSQLAAQADADYYRVDFGSGNFTIGVGAAGNLDELEAAFTDSGTHSGSAIIAVSNGDSTTHIFFDEDTSSGVDGEGLQEIATLDNVDDATTLTEDNVDVQV